MPQGLPYFSGRMPLSSRMFRMGQMDNSSLPVNLQQDEGLSFLSRFTSNRETPEANRRKRKNGGLGNTLPINLRQQGPFGQASSIFNRTSPGASMPFQFSQFGSY